MLGSDGKGEFGFLFSDNLVCLSVTNDLGCNCIERRALSAITLY